MLKSDADFYILNISIALGMNVYFYIIISIYICAFLYINETSFKKSFLNFE